MALVLALLSGPAALALTLAQPPPPAAAADEALRAGGPATEAVAAGGVASDFVAAWLSAAEDDVGSLASYTDPSSLVLPRVPVRVERSEPVRLSAVQPSRWRVVVRVELRAPVPTGEPGSGDPAQAAVDPSARPEPAAGAIDTRYFEVGIDTRTTVRPLGPPAAVAAPDLTVVPPSRGVELDPTAPVTLSVGRFLDAMLTGQGDLTPWTAPGSSLAAVAPAPYAAVRDVQVWLVGDDLPASASDPDVMAVDGTEVTARVAARLQAAAPGAAGSGEGTTGEGEVEAAESASDDGGGLVVGYELTLTARAGRWEVATLAPAGLTPGDRVPAATPTAATPTVVPASPAPASDSPAPQPTPEGTLP